MFFEISRCSNVLFANSLIMNSMFCNSSSDVKNSSFDSNSISLASSITDEIELRSSEIELKSSKYWVVSSSSESSTSANPETAGENDFGGRYFWYQFAAVAVKFLSCQRTLAIAAQQLNHFFIHENFSCKFQEHQNFQFRSYFSALTNVCIFVLERKTYFKWWHVTITLFTFRRFCFRVAFFRNITSFLSSQHCVAFVFATTSHTNSSIRSSRKNLIHLNISY